MNFLNQNPQKEKKDDCRSLLSLTATTSQQLHLAAQTVSVASPIKSEKLCKWKKTGTWAYQTISENNSHLRCFMGWRKSIPSPPKYTL